MKKIGNLNKNYPSLLVPLDIAGKLKKIGFSDETGLFKYNRDKGLIFKTNSKILVIIEKENLLFGDCTISEIDELLFGEDNVSYNVDIPSWEEVFKWFRERNLLGIIAFDIEYDSPFYYQIENEKGNTKGHIPAFNTYEEAREALVLDLIDTYIFIEKEKHCLISFYHNKQYETGSLVVMQVGEEIKISDKEELQHIWETLKEDPKLYFENLFEENNIDYTTSKMFRFKEEKGKEKTPKAIIDLIWKIIKKHNYSFDSNDLEAHYFDFSFPELYYEQLKEKETSEY